MIISKNVFNLDLRTITRTGHNFYFLTSVFVFYTYYFTRTSCVVRRRISFITLLCLSHDIYLFSTTHIRSKRESYLKCPTVSLSMMMTVSLFFFIVLRRFFFLLLLLLIDTNEMKMCVCIYM